ncbi:MAG: multifunctional CCA addition/repair protein [Gammaproteobacteria bacterium]|nr:MAG: multifunctional CCA addition/repair protein [Gammaproteobacteria bacterium]
MPDTTPELQVYLVGGAVRDRLLGLPVQERDWVVVGATPEDMIARGFRPVGKDFPVFLHPETGEEYALARTERKTGHGYGGFTFHTGPEVTLEEDLRRRDLTINAMAMTPSGELIDPYGGEEDLRQGLLRHVSPAFAEDPLRILRVARFAARFAKWGFRISHGTYALMKKMVREGEVDYLTPERVWKETEKALGEDRPAKYFEVLHRVGALARLFPELEALFGIPQPAHAHPEIDTGVHCLLALDAAARLTPERTVRFAALVHDLGKGTTPQDQLPRHLGHEERGVTLLHRMCDRLKIPNAYRELAERVVRWHGLAHRALELRPATLVDLFDHLDAWRRPQLLEGFLLACEADARGRTGHAQDPWPQGDWLRRAYAEAAKIQGGAFARAGYRGAEIRAKVREARIRALARLRRSASSQAQQPDDQDQQEQDPGEQDQGPG